MLVREGESVHVKVGVSDMEWEKVCDSVGEDVYVLLPVGVGDDVCVCDGVTLWKSVRVSVCVLVGLGVSVSVGVGVREDV